MPCFLSFSLEGCPIQHTGRCNHVSESKDRHEDHHEDRRERAQGQSRSAKHRIAYRPNRRTALGQALLTRQEGGREGEGGREDRRARAGSQDLNRGECVCGGSDREALWQGQGSE